MNDYRNMLWPMLAAIAGAITALSARPFETMTKTQIALALFVGSSFAFFVGPLIVHALYGEANLDFRVVGGIFYLLSTGSNIFIPRMIRWLSRLIGDDS